jgi:hypothetical protein
MPSVLEGGDLGSRLLTGLLLEEHIIVGVGIEGWIEIDEVYRLVTDVVVEDSRARPTAFLEGGKA